MKKQGPRAPVFLHLVNERYAALTAFGGTAVDTNTDKPITERELEQRINAWKLAITAIGAALIGAYFVYFALMLDQPPADNADKWGAFGDFVGGLLNPIVAFAAFYWLTQSVKLQRRELSETREELRKTAEAQNELVKLAALSGLTTAAVAEMAHIRGVSDAIARNRPPDSEYVVQMRYDQDHKITLAKLKIAMGAARADKETYVTQMKAMLAKYGDASEQEPVVGQ